MELENIKTGNGESGEGSSNANENGTGADTQKSFSQEDVNNIIKERLSRERSKMEKEYEEKEKLAKMSADEKSQHELNKRADELSKREKELFQKELKLQALEKLNEKELPKSLLDVLDYSSAENCNVSIDKIEKAFKESKAKASSNILGGFTPNNTGISNSPSDPFLQGLKRN